MVKSEIIKLKSELSKVKLEQEEVAESDLNNLLEKLYNLGYK